MTSNVSASWQAQCHRQFFAVKNHRRLKNRRSEKQRLLEAGAKDGGCCSQQNGIKED